MRVLATASSQFTQAVIVLSRRDGGLIHVRKAALSMSHSVLIWGEVTSYAICWAAAVVSTVEIR